MYISDRGPAENAFQLSEVTLIVRACQVEPLAVVYDVNIVLGSKLDIAWPPNSTPVLHVGRNVHLLCVTQKSPMDWGAREPNVCSARSVLTDRAFLAEPKTMLWAFMLGGLIAGAFIILFGLLGVFGAAQAITNPSRHAPLSKVHTMWEHAQFEFFVA